MGPGVAEGAAELGFHCRVRGDRGVELGGCEEGDERAVSTGGDLQGRCSFSWRGRPVSDWIVGFLGEGRAVCVVR